MINYNRLGYKIKRDFTNFSQKIAKDLKRPQGKFVYQMVYGILAGNKLDLSEIARSLKENIPSKRPLTIRTLPSLPAKKWKHSLKYGMAVRVKLRRATLLFCNTSIRSMTLPSSLVTAVTNGSFIQTYRDENEPHGNRASVSNGHNKTFFL